MTYKEIIEFQVNGMVDAGTKKPQATKLVKQMLATLKKTHSDQDILEYFRLLQNPATFQKAQTLPIHKTVENTCTKLV